MIIHPAPRARAFVLLQGPPGPLFHQLSERLQELGAETHRINICGGDRLDWPGAATNFRGRFDEWPLFFDRFLRQNNITDLLLFGDCRPYHMVAHRMAALRGIRTHVLEEGYLRPHWMTLELDGVNARSRLRKDKDWFFDQAAKLPAEPKLPPVTASFRRRVRDSVRHYTAVHLGALTYPHYQTHRAILPVVEGVGWSWKFLHRKRREREAGQVIDQLRDKPFFLFPLQLSGDYQIRSHSPFPDMRAATAYVLESFAAHAPADTHLLVKTHPLDCSFFSWRAFVSRHAKRLGVADRVHYADGGDLEKLAARSSGMVCVNSTSATLALRADRPVCVLGDAIYKVPGLVFDGHLDAFWADPPPPEPALYEAFRRVLLNECLVRGGLASESAVATLVESMADKLLGGVAQTVESQSSTILKWPDQVGALNAWRRAS